MGTLVGGTQTTPATDFNFVLYTPNTGRFPRNGYGVESIEGLYAGSITKLRYGEGNDKFIKTLLGQTEWKDLKISRAFDGHTGASDWFEEATENGDNSALDVPYEDVVVSVFRRGRFDLVVAQFTYPKMVIGEYETSKLERPGGGKIWMESFTLYVNGPPKRVKPAFGGGR